MRLRGAERLELEGQLHKAIQRGELLVHFQPEVDLHSGNIVGVEALVRWRHGERGIVLPADFVPLAEETGLIVPIGEWVLGEACRQRRAWVESGVCRPELRVAVNLSPRQLADKRLCEVVERTLAETGVEPGVLCLEITESAVIDDGEAGPQTLARLKDLGALLAIDDFGVGFSSLSQIRHLPPVDVLKIDRSFIDGLQRHREDRAIVAAVTGMGHSLGLTVVAEGIETAEQAAEVRELGCDLGQGFHFASPAPADDIAHVLARASLGELKA
jgi:EAL domain-containing protein (putative c-di-GMP-specific phosphodiesterase class I)